MTAKLPKPRFSATARTTEQLDEMIDGSIMN